MKNIFNLIIFIITFNICNTLNGQDYTLHHNKDKTSKFKHEYSFSFINKNDTNTYENLIINKDSGNTDITIILTDLNNEAVIGTWIKIINKESNDTIKLLSDINGSLSLNVPFSKISILIQDSFYDRFEKPYNLNTSSNINLKIKLGFSGKEHIIHQINSKNKLSEEEVDKIIECIYKNRNINIQNCSCNNIQIGIQI